VHERAEDLIELQAVIDASYARAGAHLAAIHEPERRLDAAAVAAELTRDAVAHARHVDP
jgi:hypothetical protein